MLITFRILHNILSVISLQMYGAGGALPDHLVDQFEVAYRDLRTAISSLSKLCDALHDDKYGKEENT